jgi:fructuronate reductase
MRYASGIDERGNAIEVQDPLAGCIAELVRPLRSPAEVVSAFFDLKVVFGEDLPKNDTFTQAVVKKLAALFSEGAAVAIRRPM